MKTVAFETSAAMGGVAIGDQGALIGETRFAEKLVHARELIPALDALVAAAGWTPADLQRLVVSIGPGSFTGLRIGLAAAKVLALELGAELIGVDSLDVLAANAPFDGPFAVLVDARRESVYLRRYQRPGAPEGPFEMTLAKDLRLDPGLPLLGTGARVYREHWPDNPLAPEAADIPSPAALLALVDQGKSLDPLTAVPIYGMSGVRR